MRSQRVQRQRLQRFLRELRGVSGRQRHGLWNRTNRQWHGNPEAERGTNGGSCGTEARHSCLISQ